MLLWFGVTCAVPLDAPSALEGEQYLCDPTRAVEWEQRIDDCRSAYRADGSCKGVVSFRGLVFSQYVVADSPVSKFNFTDVPRQDQSLARDYFVWGSSPYYIFSLDLPDFDAQPGLSRSGFIVDGICGTVISVCFSAILNIEARGGTALLRMKTLLRTVQVDTREEIRATFAGDLDTGGNVAGCFDLNLAQPP